MFRERGRLKAHPAFLHCNVVYGPGPYRPVMPWTVLNFWWNLGSDINPRKGILC